jgi:uncharacterized protein YuzE
VPAAPRFSMTVDTEANAAYLQLSDEEVARTIVFSEDIYVDVDQMDMVVGIEVLDLGVQVPLDDLATRFHISSETYAKVLDTISWVEPPRPQPTGTAAAYTLAASPSANRTANAVPVLSS